MESRHQQDRQDMHGYENEEDEEDYDRAQVQGEGQEEDEEEEDENDEALQNANQQQQQQQQSEDTQGYEYANPRIGGSSQNQRVNYGAAIDSHGYDGNNSVEGARVSEVDQVSEDIEEKIRVFEEFAKDKGEEQVLNIRMHQLAFSKILVFTHGKSPFKLVEAHTKLGVAYLNYKCFEQAIDHLTIALKKNGGLFGEVKQSQAYHAEILTQLAKCYAEVQSYEDALELLTKANELHKTVRGDGDIKQVETLTCIAKCHTQMKEYEKAQQIIGLIYDIQSQNFGLESEQIAMTAVENAKICALKDDFHLAIDNMNQAIDTLIKIDFNQPETVAELYQTLSGYYEQSDLISEQVDTLQKASTLFEQIFGPADKRVIKVKRQISMIFLKNKQNEEALAELLEIEDLENKVYGDNSVQVAKTLRIIGTIKVLTSGTAEAQKYFAKALKIFEENGLKNQVKDTKQKLQMAKDLKGKRNDQPSGRQPDYYE